jgi:uncharacterized protein
MNMQPVTRLTIIVESIFGLLAIALAGFFGFFDTTQENFRQVSTTWTEVISTSLFCCVPMLSLLWMLERLNFWPLGQMSKLIDTRIAPLFAKCQWWEFVIIAVCAGVGEELAFRWCLQGGLQATTSISSLGAIMVSGALFALCHSLSAQYFWFSFFISVYLGICMNVSGSVIGPITAHAMYDYFALLIIRQRFLSLPAETRKQIYAALEQTKASASLSEPK